MSNVRDDTTVKIDGGVIFRKTAKGPFYLVADGSDKEVALRVKTEKSAVNKAESKLAELAPVVSDEPKQEDAPKEAPVVEKTPEIAPPEPKKSNPTPKPKTEKKTDTEQADPAVVIMRADIEGLKERIAELNKPAARKAREKTRNLLGRAIRAKMRNAAISDSNAARNMMVGFFRQYTMYCSPHIVLSGIEEMKSQEIEYMSTLHQVFSLVAEAKTRRQSRKLEQRQMNRYFTQSFINWAVNAATIS